MRRRRNVGPAPTPEDTEEGVREFYRSCMRQLQRAGVPFLVGGAYALAHYTGFDRHTRDFDIFVCRRDILWALHVLSVGGCRTDLTFPHWLGKAVSGDAMVDVIFASGNAVAEVDDLWFEYSVEANVLGVQARLCPPEEIIWSKAYIMERERFDGADVAHILRTIADKLDWPRLLARFGPHWRVLLSHLILLDFIYPSEPNRVPDWVMGELLDRLRKDITGMAPTTEEKLCQGTLLSRAQYLVDVDKWGYRDARLLPTGKMTRDEIARWTAGIEQQKT